MSPFCFLCQRSESERRKKEERRDGKKRGERRESEAQEVERVINSCTNLWMLIFYTLHFNFNDS